MFKITTQLNHIILSEDMMMMTIVCGVVAAAAYTGSLNFRVYHELAKTAVGGSGVVSPGRCVRRRYARDCAPGWLLVYCYLFCLAIIIKRDICFSSHEISLFYFNKWRRGLRNVRMQRLTLAFRLAPLSFVLLIIEINFSWSILFNFWINSFLYLRFGRMFELRFQTYKSATC